jgi:pentatricopeptide repeat protein
MVTTWLLRPLLSSLPDHRHSDPLPATKPAFAKSSSASVLVEPTKTLIDCYQTSTAANTSITSTARRYSPFTGVKPDTYIYGSLVKLYCKSDMVDKAAIVVQEMTDYGLVPDQIIKTNLIQAYGSFGRYDEAEQLFRSLQDLDGVAVSSMLALHDAAGIGREALSNTSSPQPSGPPLRAAENATSTQKPSPFPA